MQTPCLYGTLSARRLKSPLCIIAFCSPTSGYGLQPCGVMQSYKESGPAKLKCHEDRKSGSTNVMVSFKHLVRA